MANTIDRLRLARAVWTVNARLVGLPSKRRKAVRQELQANLRAAAAERGSREAVRQLGDLRLLASGYLDAEYGEGRPRPRYLQGLLWACGVEVAYTAVTVLWLEAFTAGAQTVTPHPDGTFGAGGGLWLPEVGVIFTGGRVDGWDLSFPLPAFFLYPLVAFLLGARVWRWLPRWQRSRRLA
jgi:hypothetical protein